MTTPTVPSNIGDMRRRMEEATATFLGAVDLLNQDGWEAESLLPGWRPREIVAHVHHNALALRNLVTWATIGVETPMYTSREQRDADILATAQRPVAELRQLVRRSADELNNDLDGMDEAAWETRVATAQGCTVRAWNIVWMRTREVAVHAIDLDVGLTFTDLPPSFVSALVNDVVDSRLHRGEGPTLAAWLTGRGMTGEDLDRWI